MTALATVRAPQPLHETGGAVVAYFIPADLYDQMQGELAALRAKVASLQRQRDGYVAQLTEAYHTLIPVPLTDEELNAPVQNPNAIRDLIADLETDQPVLVQCLSLTPGSELQDAEHDPPIT